MRCLAGLMAAAVLAAGAAGAQTACPQGGVTVTAPDPGLSARVCAAAEAGAQVLGQCGLGLRAPVHVEVVAQITMPHADCLANYNCDTGVVRILPPDVMLQRHSDNAILRAAAIEAFHASAVVHELAHAAFHQTSPLSAPSPVAQEYVAYAMQLLALPPEARARLVAMVPESAPVDAQDITPGLMLFAPARFAARVWMHFDAAENGCAFVADLVAGRETMLFGDL